RPAVAGFGERVRASRRDHAEDTVAGEAPPEERRKIGVAHGTRRTAEDRGVDGDPVAASGRDFAPARAGRVTGLDADQPREHTEQVVPRVQAPAAGDRIGALAYDRADETIAHRDLRDPRPHH